MPFASISVSDVVEVKDEGVNFRWHENLHMPFAVRRVKLVSSDRKNCELTIHMDDGWTAARVLDGECRFEDMEQQAAAEAWARVLLAGAK